MLIKNLGTATISAQVQTIPAFQTVLVKNKNTNGTASVICDARYSRRPIRRPPSITVMSHFEVKMLIIVRYAALQSLAIILHSSVLFKKFLTFSLLLSLLAGIFRKSPYFFYACGYLFTPMDCYHLLSLLRERISSRKFQINSRTVIHKRGKSACYHSPRERSASPALSSTEILAASSLAR